MGSLLLARSCILVITTIKLSSERDKAQSQARSCSSKALILIYGEAWSQSITVLPRHPLPLFSFLKILASVFYHISSSSPSFFLSLWLVLWFYFLDFGLLTLELFLTFLILRAMVRPSPFKVCFLLFKSLVNDLISAIHIIV